MNTVVTQESHFRIGVVGYVHSWFDRDHAATLVDAAIDEAARKLFQHSGQLKPVAIVLGTTGRGIHGVSYKVARKAGRITVGIAPAMARDCKRVEVDVAIYAGHKWGEELPTFLENIDALVRVGGEDQAHLMAKQARELGILVVERSMRAQKKDRKESI